MKNRSLNQILLLITIALLLGIAAAFFTGFLKITPAYASGSVQVSASEAQAVQIVSASTDDPGMDTDPGQNVHVGQCTATLHKKFVGFSVFNGYPGYACRLQTTLENRGQGAVRLDRLEYEVPPGLKIQGPEYAEPLILAPGQRKQQDFAVMVAEDAEEGETHDFHIWQVFTPGD